MVKQLTGNIIGAGLGIVTTLAVVDLSLRATERVVQPVQRRGRPRSIVDIL